MRTFRRDLNFAVSMSLLLSATLSALTGYIALLWDLNEFVYHTYASYAVTLFALAHVWLNGRRIVNYLRFRFAAKPARQPALASERRESRPQPAPVPGGALGRAWHTVVSRRGMLALLLGGIGGWSLSRSMREPPAVAYGADLGLVYHQWSKPGMSGLFGAVASWGQQPALYKSYPGLPQITLPPPEPGPTMPLVEVLARRRSERAYAGEALSLAELSQLLALTGGINTERWGLKLRAAPSAGALYPLELYPLIHNVAGLERGLYHYDVQNHRLTLLRAGDMRSDVVRQGMGQQFLGECNVVLYSTLIFQRMRWKYQDRTYRYALLEAGHMGQNSYLAATALGLGACAIGAFVDDEVNAMLGVDGSEEAAVYMLALGKLKRET